MISLGSYPFWRYGSSVGVVVGAALIYIYIYMRTAKYLHWYNQYSYPNIEANIFEARFLKRAAKLGSSFLAI